MEMMYRIIADELKAMDIKDMQPEDYLNFFCLGNREEPSSNGSPESEKSADKSAAVISCCIFLLFIVMKKKCQKLLATKTFSYLLFMFPYVLDFMYILIGLAFYSLKWCNFVSRSSLKC